MFPATDQMADHFQVIHAIIKTWVAKSRKISGKAGNNSERIKKKKSSPKFVLSYENPSGKSSTKFS
jgi:hypothetical protein